MNEKTPSEIFRQAGINPEIIGSENPKRCLLRWRKSYHKHGDSGLIGEKRGGSSSRHPKALNISLEDKLRAAEAKIAYLEMENEITKKVRRTRKEAERLDIIKS